MKYRGWIMAAALQGALLAAGESFTPYHEALLLDENGKALQAEKLEPDTAYFFQYPYSSTPALLVRNAEPDENNVTHYRLHAYLAINPATFTFVNHDVAILSLYKQDLFGNDVVRFCDDKSTYSIHTGENIADSNVSRHPSLSRVVLKEEGDKIYALGVTDIAPMSGMFKEKHDALVKRFRSLWNAKVKYSKPRVLRHDQFSIVTVRCNAVVPKPTENNESVENNVSEMSAE